jgi:AcrR family transcriptional regulator
VAAIDLRQGEPGRRAGIIAAAYQQLADKGLAGLRMRDVALAAGVNISTVHYHLTSKTELIRAVVGYAHQQFSEHATPPASASPARRLAVHLKLVFGLLESNPGLGRVLAEIALYSERDPVVAGIVRASEEQWLAALQAMLAPLPRRTTRTAGLVIILAVKGACLPPTSTASLRAARRELTSSLQGRLSGG